jgi:LmbE family N-acetylglucosaminyl deacetylase
MPRLSETEWAPLLNESTSWQPNDAPMLVVVPHPDDETLAVGGLIAIQRAKGVDVTIIAVSDGENAYEQNQGPAELRREEQICALERLGVPRSGMTELRDMASPRSQNHPARPPR